MPQHRGLGDYHRVNVLHTRVRSFYEFVSRLGRCRARVLDSEQVAADPHPRPPLRTGQSDHLCIHESIWPFHHHFHHFLPFPRSLRHMTALRLSGVSLALCALVWVAAAVPLPGDVVQSERSWRAVTERPRSKGDTAAAADAATDAATDAQECHRRTGRLSDL